MLGDVLLLIMMCSKMLNHINVSFCSVGTQFTLFFQTHKLNQHSYFMAYQTGLCSKVTCIHNDLALFVSLFWFLKWFGLRYSFISFWDFVMWSHFSSAIFTSKLNPKAFQLTQLNRSTVLSKFSGSPFISPSSSSNALFLNASCSFPLTLLKAPLLILHSGLCWIYKFFGLFGILFNHTIYLTTVFSRLSMVDISFTISLFSSAEASSTFILLINMQQK